MQLDRYYGRIQAAGVELYAVSVDPPEVSARLKQRLEADFTFLSDPEGILLDALGVLHRTGSDRGDIAFPTAILVDERGIVRWTFQSDTYRERARPDEIFRAIAALHPPG